jgi:hypothetical protein
MLEMGAHESDLAASRRGNVSLFGLGREWLRRPVTQPGTFFWPAVENFNVVNTHRAQVTSLKAVWPRDGGRMQRMRVNRDGSGSVSMYANNFLTRASPESAPETVEAFAYPYEPRSWRTVGVDYSGRTGAAAALVFVEGHVGLADRRQAWEADLGDVPTNNVEIAGLTFTVTTAGSKATMRGTVVYPTTALIEYQPPQGGRGGRLQIWRTKPERAADVDLIASLDRKMEEISLAFTRKVEDDVEEDLRLALDLPLEDKSNPSEIERLKRQHLNYFAKMFKHTTSTSMGGPNRRPQAAASWVIVLTVQEGEPPVVEPLPFEDENLLKIGGRPVYHEEYLLEFR